MTDENFSKAAGAFVAVVGAVGLAMAISANPPEVKSVKVDAGLFTRSAKVLTEVDKDR